MKKNLCILGFGIVGKSVLRFLATYRAQFAQKFFLSADSEFTVMVADKRDITHEEQLLLQEYTVSFINLKTTTLDELFEQVDVVIASPGIDIAAQKKQYAQKIIQELDLFALFFSKPVVAISGTIGKTTLTQLVTELIHLDSCVDQKEFLQKSSAFMCGHATGCLRERSITGGNIGLGMLDLLPHQENVELALLELSSFQLEDTNYFAPKIGILTTLYANHLDRHKTIDAYFAAKWNLFVHQTVADSALLGIDLITNFAPQLEVVLPVLKSQVYFVSTQPLTIAQKMFMQRHHAAAYYVQNNSLFLWNNEKSIELIKLAPIVLELGFLNNWIFAYAALHRLGKNLDWIYQPLLLQAHSNLVTEIGAHRLELCATLRGVDFYNDSKATVIEATQAAITKCLQKNKPLLVILGGIAKGVDRSPLIEFVKQTQGIKKVISFGPGSYDLEGIENYPTLQAALDAMIAIMQSGDQILFSPSGASFDLFNNYQHRGDVFKELIAKYH